MLVVHPHLHRRRTGVTSHVEAVVRATPGAAVLESRLFGEVLDPSLRRVGWGEALALARREGLVWHAHRNAEMLAGLLLKLLSRKVRVVFTRHASHRPTGPTRWLLKRADRVVALTKIIADALPVPSQVVPHGVDVARFSPPSDRDAAFAQLGVGGRYGIGVVGRVRPAKGQGDFVEAIAPLLMDHPEWRALCVGSVRPEDRAFADGLMAKAPSLVLPGEQSDVARWYRGLSVLVQPSHAEGLSLAFLEGLASGCCVVATRISDFPTIIEHGRTGFLYEPGDIAALREILAELMRDPGKARAVGLAAAEEARARHGVEREAQRLLEVYRAAGAA